MIYFNKKFITLAALLLLACADNVSLQAQSPGPSLLSNGNFQSAVKDPGWPDDWGKAKGVSWETEKGKHFLRLVSQEPGVMLMAYREMAIPRGVKGLEISIRYRTANLKPGAQTWFDARTIFHLLDAKRQPVMPEPKVIVFSGKAADWTDVNIRSVLPPEATTLVLMPSLFQVASGTLDLAEIRVTAMSDSDTAAITAATEAQSKKEAEHAAIIEKEMALPPKTPELKVSGNKIVTSDGQSVWLQGLCTDSMQWSMGDNILWSIHVAIDEWKSNVIRLPVLDTFWFGHGKGQPANTEEDYRGLVDKAVKLCAAKGVYLVLDLHAFGAPTEAHLAFWKDAAARYKNNPAVLFELFNEPHNISWEIWRNGGSLNSDKNKNSDVNPLENKEKVEGDECVGMQAIVDAVRATGAKNMIVSGGLDWSYDLTGIVNGYALDDKGGDGVMYVSHIYPWKKDWKDKVLVAVDKYPIIITEIGCPQKWEDFSFIQPSQRYPLEGWSENVLGMIQKYKLNWTGFSFHPHCGPQVIQDWNYTPTPYWGVYVKAALAGKQYELKELR
ncbi:MAG: glycoside hydrolase family 5 protein [Chthoniobacteraceae bacterium]